MHGYWSTLGAILGTILIFLGLLAWLLGTEFSNPATHPILYPYGQIALIAGPVVMVMGAVLLPVSFLIRRRKEPPPPPKVSPEELASFRPKRSTTGRDDERDD